MGLGRCFSSGAAGKQSCASNSLSVAITVNKLHVLREPLSLKKAEEYLNRGPTEQESGRDREPTHLKRLS